jgi:hypothetical protein
MKKFYLHDGSGPIGPFDIPELKNKQVIPTTPVWFQGLSTWQQAGTITELKSLFEGDGPPPLAPKHETQPVVLSPIPKKRSLIRRLIPVAILGIIILVGAIIYKNYDREQLQNEEFDQKKYVRENITSYVTAQRNTYQYSKPGNKRYKRNGLYN